MSNLSMMKKCFFVIGFFIISSVQAQNDKAFLWQVTTEKGLPEASTVYLFGSIHFANKSFYPLRDEVVEAFRQADTLVVEVDISKVDHQAYNKRLFQQGVYKDGTTIKDNISNATWLQLRKRLHYLNVSYDSIKNYKPGVLVLTLSAMQAIKMGFNPALGIDAYFLAKVVGQKSTDDGKYKEIIELESLEQQLQLFLNIPNAEPLLKESLRSLEETEQLMADMVRFWKSGDEPQMNKLLFDDALREYPAFSAIYDVLFYERNRQMTVKIESMLQAKGLYFVVVGAGHLIGERGIVHALREKGYQIKRM